MFKGKEGNCRLSNYRMINGWARTEANGIIIVIAGVRKLRSNCFPICVAEDGDEDEDAGDQIRPSR